jgi:hypothetical protein
MGLRSSVGILLLTLGCIAGILLGILLVVRWQLAVPAKVLEDKGVTDAMFRSSQSTSGNRGRIFLILLLFGVLGQALEKLCNGRSNSRQELGTYSCRRGSRVDGRWPRWELCLFCYAWLGLWQPLHSLSVLCDPLPVKRLLNSVNTNYRFD